MMSNFLVDADVAVQWGCGLNRSLGEHTYMPADADAGPAAFVTWMNKYGGGGPPGALLAEPLKGVSHDPLPRQQLLDRYHQHTFICKSCRTAYKQLTTLRTAATIVACILAAAALGSLAAAAPVKAVALLGVGAVAAAGVAAVAADFVQKLVFVDYDKHHASKKA